jgi:hypothetical protein
MTSTDASEADAARRAADAFAAGISADFGHRFLHETQFAEALVVEASIKHAPRHVGRWMKPRRCGKAGTGFRENIMLQEEVRAG